jgi:hypothetical protein
MATFVDTTVKQIDTHLSELIREVSRLEAARAALVGNGGSPARTPRRRRGRPRKTTTVTAAASASPATASPTPRRRGRPRKTTTATAAAAPSSATTKSRTPSRKRARPRGRRAGNTRATEALALVKKQPGITIPALAEAMKIQPNYLYRVLPKLAADGQVKRDGKGWHRAA